MIEISFRGYVKLPTVKKTAGGTSYNSFGVRTKCGKNKDGSAKYTYLDCSHWGKDGMMPILPPDNAYVTVKGFQDWDEVEKDGKKTRYPRQIVQSLEVAPPRDGDSPASSKTASGGPDLSWMDAE